jgi:hypothetical protein
VNVVLRVGGQLVVDDEVHFGNVDSSGKYIGANKRAYSLIPKVINNLIPLVLLNIRSNIFSFDRSSSI